MTYVGKLDANKVYGADAGGKIGEVTATGGATRPYPPDANDLHVWYLNESAGETSFANSGTSSLTLSPSGGIVSGSTGIWSPGVYLSNTTAGTCLSSGDTTDDPGGGYVTASIWVYFFANAGENAVMFVKFANSSGWSAPYASWRLARYSNATHFSVATGPLGADFHDIGANTALAPDMVSDQWNHVGLTYDGTKLRGYVNGNLSAESSIAGSVYYPGSPGAQYVVGTDSGRSTLTTVRGVYADARVASVVRPDSWFRDVYRRGLYGL